MPPEYNLITPGSASVFVKGKDDAGGRQLRCLALAVSIKRCESFFTGTFMLLLLLVSLPSSRADEKGKALAKEPSSVVIAPRITSSVAFSRDGKMLIWNCDGVIHAQNIKTRKRDTLAWKGGANAVELSPDGSILAIISYEERISEIPDLVVPPGDPFVTLWKVKPGQRLAAMKWKPEEVLRLGPLVFSPDGRTLAAGTLTESRSRRCRVPLWEVPSGKLQRALEVGMEHSVDDLQFSPDGKTLATGGLARNQDYGKQESLSDLPSHLKLWDVATGKMQAEYKGMKGPIYSVAFSPDGKLLAAGGNLGKEINEIVLWDVAKNERRTTLTGHRDSVYALMFSHDGKLLASGGAYGELKLWDLKTWQEIRSLKGHKDSITSVAFSPDDSMLASGSRDGTVRLWYLRQTRKDKSDR
jgi:WD40 repeat protein